MILRKIMNMLVPILVTLVVFALFLRWYEPRLLYYPQRPLDATPAAAGLPFEEVWLTTADGVRIHGWQVSHPRATAQVIFFHGNAGNISHRLEKLEIFHELSVNTLMIDYRGYGLSDGEPHEAGTYADGEAALAWARDHAAGLPVVLFGESIGSGIAVELATRHAVAGLILEEPLASVAAIGQRMFPFLPVRLLVRNRYDNLSKIHRVTAPLLMFHSRTDEVVPFKHGQRLFDAANEPKTFVELRGGHNDAFWISRDSFQAALAEFFAARRAHH